MRRFCADCGKRSRALRRDYGCGDTQRIEPAADLEALIKRRRDGSFALSFRQRIRPQLKFEYFACGAFAGFHVEGRPAGVGRP
jgi:hypothetical protein